MINSIRFLLFIAFLSLHGCINPFPLPVIRGINYFFGDNTSATAASTLESIQNKAAPTQANILAISFQICQSSANSNYVFRDPSLTPSNASLTTLINFAASVGMQSFLKPLIQQNSSDTSFAMAQVNPTNITLWFESYTAVMLEFGQLSESVGNVYMICVGLELEQISKYANYWIALIQQMRSVYSGKLSYCSDTLGGETEQISFWKELDFIGLDIYVPLVNPFNASANLRPTYAEMQSEFNYIWNVGVMDWYLASAYQHIPMFITESGYPSSNQGLQTPWMIPSSNGCIGTSLENETAQAAALEVLSVELPQYMPSTVAGFVYFVFDDVSNSWYQNKTNSSFPCSWSPVDKKGYQVLCELFALETGSIPTSVPTVGGASNNLLSHTGIAIIVSVFGSTLCVVFVILGVIYKRYNKNTMPAARQVEI